MAPYAPDLVLTAVQPGSPHADWPLHAGKEPRQGRATAYACRGYRCDAPTDDAATLTAQVGALAEPASPASPVSQGGTTG